MHDNGYLTSVLVECPYTWSELNPLRSARKQTRCFVRLDVSVLKLRVKDTKIAGRNTKQHGSHSKNFISAIIVYFHSIFNIINNIICQTYIRHNVVCT